MSTNKLMQNKCFLYATGFFSGMSVMAIELGASRMLAPYFSSSQIVWTVIIGAIMVALALGNVWGGKMADKNPDPAKLYHRLLFAAIWVALIPFLGKYIITGISLGVGMITTKNFLVWASLATCLVIFVFPLMLLGTVTPCLVKYTTQDLEDNASVVGKLSALNTIGCIIGTFLPTFVTIPAVGTAATFLIFAGILAGLSIVYFVATKKFVVKGALCVGIIMAMSIVTTEHSFAFWESNIVYEDESIYNYLQVKEDEHSIILSTNVLAGVQSIKMKNEKLTGMYYDYALAAPFMAGLHEKAGDVLILGLGTGTFATMCDEYFPNARVEGVEIDQKIADLATEYFDLPDTVDVIVYDGRAYLQNAKKYDVIMIDAYQDITIPFQMSTVEFFTQVKEHLNEDGVMVVNLNMTSAQDGSINQYLCQTIASVFPEVYTVNVGSGTNTELFAFDNPETLKRFEAAYLAYDEEHQVAELTKMMTSINEKMVKVEKGEHILTDDKAPVEVLGMKVLDEMIQGELDYLKEMLKTGNLMEIVNGI